MSANHISPPEMKIKILKEGEEVINLWTGDLGYDFVIKNQKGEVFIISMNLDENKMPRINQTPNLVITHIDETGDMGIMVKETPPEIKILKEGDEVINLSPVDSVHDVAIKNQKDETGDKETPQEIKIKILKEGEEVINLWPVDSGYHVAIKNQKGEFFVISISRDENKMDRINQTPNLLITHIDETGVMGVSIVKKTPEGRKATVETF